MVMVFTLVSEAQDFLNLTVEIKKKKKEEEEQHKMREAEIAELVSSMVIIYVAPNS